MTREEFTTLLLDFTANRDCTPLWYAAVVDWVRMMRTANAGNQGQLPRKGTDE